MHNQQLTAVGGDINVDAPAERRARPRATAPSSTWRPTSRPNFVLTAGGSYNHTEMKDPNLARGPVRFRLHRARPAQRRRATR